MSIFGDKTPREILSNWGLALGATLAFGVALGAVGTIQVTQKIPSPKEEFSIVANPNPLTKGLEKAGLQPKLCN